MSVIFTPRARSSRWKALWPLALLLAVSIIGGIWLWRAWPQVLMQSAVWQRSLNLELSRLLQAVAENPAAAGLSLLGFSFVYGVLHALGPGHGKIVITTWLATHPAKLKSSIGLTLAASLLQMAGSPRFFEADPQLIEITKQALNENHVAAHTGLIVSGDRFVAQKTQVENIKQHFPKALCAEMEAAAIAQVCTIYDVPFIITRSLSDIFGKGNSGMQFDEYLQIASAASAKMCCSLVEKL